MTENREKGLTVVREMLGEEVAQVMASAGSSKAFGAKRGDIALRFAFGEMWARPGLDRRSRSLVTLGMLIALRQTEELKFHVRAALNNGLTVAEIEEVIYHSIPYCGLPASGDAIAAASGVLRSMKLID